jgi:LacI family transcriptional regulator
MVLGITRALQKHDFHLCISEAPDGAQEAAEALPKVVRDLSADGLLINMIADIPDSFIEMVRSLNTPAIWMNSKQAADCAHPDDFRAGQMATKHLLEFGHRDIVYVNTGAFDEPRQHYSARDRRDGYQAAMRAANLEGEWFSLPPMPGTWEQIAADNRVQSAREFLQARRPTAIVAYGMDVALPLLYAAQQMGWQVPQDLSIVVFREDPDPMIGIPFTTVCVSMWMVGGVAAEMLVEKINHPRQSLPTRTTEPYLFPGATCAAPR